MSAFFPRTRNTYRGKSTKNYLADLNTNDLKPTREQDGPLFVTYIRGTRDVLQNTRGGRCVHNHRAPLSTKYHDSSGRVKYDRYGFMQMREAILVIILTEILIDGEYSTARRRTNAFV